MLSIITLKKIQEGKGLERNGVKGSKGGLMEEVTLEQPFTLLCSLWTLTLKLIF